MSENQMNRLVHIIFRELKSKNLVVFKAKEERVYARSKEVIKEDLARENHLDDEVEKMMDHLERSGAEEFQRYKMFPMLKKKLAEQKGIVLDDRISHFTSLIVDGIWKDDLVDFEDEEISMRIAKKGAQIFVDEMSDVDEKAKHKVDSLKRNVVEGSPEWDILYRKYYEEELKRRGN